MYFYNVLICFVYIIIVNLRYSKQPLESVCRRPRRRDGPLETLLDLTRPHTDPLSGFTGFERKPHRVSPEINS